MFFSREDQTSDELNKLTDLNPLCLLCFCASLLPSLLPSLLSNHCVAVVTLSPPSFLLSGLYISVDDWLVFQTERGNECRQAAQRAIMTPVLTPEEETPASTGEISDECYCFHQLNVKSFYFFKAGRSSLASWQLLFCCTKKKIKVFLNPEGSGNALGDAGRGGGE